MSESRFCVVLVVLTALWTLSREDSEVTCVFNSSCVLPCEFQVGSHPVIHWIYMIPGSPHIHSYYNNQDQLGYQNHHFRGRTSLFQDQISRGNASLLLRGVQVQDQGRYKCYTSTIEGNKESFINLKTEAPVSEVHIYQEKNWITCISDGIYPKPELTWSTNPASNTEQQPQTRVQHIKDQLYSISCSLIVSDRSSDLSYSCTISTESNQRRATLNKPVLMNVSESRAILSCSSSDVPVSSFTWRFNQSQIILTKTERDYRVSEEWRKHVEEVSESGSLTLQSLSSQLNGVYTCEVTNNQETIISNTFLRINDESSAGRVVAGLFVAAVVVVAGIIGFIIWAITTGKLCFKDQDSTHQHVPLTQQLQEPPSEEDSDVSQGTDGGIQLTESKTGPDMTRSDPGAEVSNGHRLLPDRAVVGPEIYGRSGRQLRSLFSCEPAK